MKIAFLSIGNELLDGRVQDTNMVFAGRSLRDLV
jgi:molybdopterin-biosynthesis enzyme MoeA-like protein